MPSIIRTLLFASLLFAGMPEGYCQKSTPIRASDPQIATKPVLKHIRGIPVEDAVRMNGAGAEAEVLDDIDITDVASLDYPCSDKPSSQKGVRPNFKRFAVAKFVITKSGSVDGLEVRVKGDTTASLVDSIRTAVAKLLKQQKFVPGQNYKNQKVDCQASLLIEFSCRPGKLTGREVIRYEPVKRYE